MIRRRIPTSNTRRLALTVLLVASLLAAVSCSNLGYYSQAAWGQVRILAKRQSIAKLVDDTRISGELREKLRSVLAMRRFAVDELHLPDNGSYTAYVELDQADDGSRRRYVIWTVVAAPELATTPVTWCFPVAGCVSYRGYFSPRRARRFAERLDEKGYDVAVSGRTAYSTIGWFKDPVLSTVIDYPDVHLAGLIFHEMTHQLIYVKDDTRFNESLASAVEIEGVRRWLEASGQDDSMLDDYLAGIRRDEDFASLVIEYRERLEDVFATAAGDEEKRRRKAAVFESLKRAYRDLRSLWGDVPAYDSWFEQDLNNAHLVSVGAYHGFVPGFQELLRRHDGDLVRFYDSVRELAELAPEEREVRLTPPPPLPPEAPHRWRRTREIRPR